MVVYGVLFAIMGAPGVLIGAGLVSPLHQASDEDRRGSAFAAFGMAVHRLSLSPTRAGSRCGRSCSTCRARRTWSPISGRKGRQRYWDLAGRVHPPGPVLDLATATRFRDERRLAALGVARSSGPQFPGEPPYVGQAGEPAEVDGVPGVWRVHPEYLSAPFEGRTALLSPFDRRIHDRVRAGQLFGFEYILEMYKPAAKRRWGYYALPILHDDRLVGKLDATGDREAGTLTVNAIHEDVPFTKAMAAAVRAEAAELAGWLRLEVRAAG